MTHPYDKEKMSFMDFMDSMKLADLGSTNLEIEILDENEGMIIYPREVQKKEDGTIRIIAY